MGSMRPSYQLAPPEVVKSVVVDTEVVRDFVHDRDLDLLDELIEVLAHRAQGESIDRDLVGEFHQPVAFAFGEGYSLVQAKEVGLLVMSILDGDHHVLHQCLELWVEGVNRLLDMTDEGFEGQRVHVRRVGLSAPEVRADVR